MSGITAKWISDSIYEMELLDIPLRRKETDEIGRYLAKGIRKKLDKPKWVVVRCKSCNKRISRHSGYCPHCQIKQRDDGN